MLPMSLAIAIIPEFKLFGKVLLTKWQQCCHIVRFKLTSVFNTCIIPSYS